MFDHFFSYLFSLPHQIIPFLIAISVIVFVHEYGHFWVARRCGVYVSDFSIGFGPKIWGWVDRFGTHWKISWIPLGGYVKFLGDINEASASAFPLGIDKSSPDWDKTFHAKPLWQRALVIAAGPFANYLLAFILFVVLAIFAGVPNESAQEKAVIASVKAGYPAYQAGIHAGDQIISIEGKPVNNFFDLQKSVLESAGKELKILVLRGKETLPFKVTPLRDPKIGGFVLGLTSQVGHLEKQSFMQAVHFSLREIGRLTSQSLAIPALLVSGNGAQLLSGPLGIAQATSQAATQGFWSFLQMLALLSVSIGFINLFPIPLLDGGHLLYYFFEAIRGRPLSARIQEIGFKVGMGFVLTLMLVATWNDLARLFSKWFGA